MDRITLGTSHVSMEFPGVKALSDVNFEVASGAIHAVLGANGAGKSTLMKVLAGANPGYTGDVLYNGKAVKLNSPASAKALGIQTVYQEVDTALIPTLSVAENVMFDHLVMHMGHRQFVNFTGLRKEAGKVLERLDIHIPLNRLVGSLSLAEKQMVLIARTVQCACRFLILDEPTAPLSDTETEGLFRLCKHLAKMEAVAIIFISHRIHEVLEICDSYTIMRGGKIVDCAPVTEKTTTGEIVTKMLGRSSAEIFCKETCHIGKKLLEAEHLSEAEGRVKDASFYVREGEIVGIVGLVGAGKSELLKTLFGALKKSSGSIIYAGKKIKIKKPSDAVKNGIALVPEERRKEGVLISETVDFNLSAACLNKFCRFSFISRKRTAENARSFVAAMGIQTPSIYQRVGNLSGGNQQKTAVGKWLAAECDVYLFDEPTKGVDVGAKAELFKLINGIAKKGNAVIYASCENTEILTITDRMYVMFGGQIVAELETADTCEDEIMHYATGGRKERGV